MGHMVIKERDKRRATNGNIEIHERLGRMRYTNE